MVLRVKPTPTLVPTNNLSTLAETIPSVWARGSALEPQPMLSKQPHYHTTS